MVQCQVSGFKVTQTACNGGNWIDANLACAEDLNLYINLYNRSQIVNLL